MCTAAVQRTDLTTFHVTGLPEPATLARVVEVFALRSLLPRAVAAEATSQDLRIALTLATSMPRKRSAWPSACAPSSSSTR
jgi:hypothetical protein